jgi:AraC-like DNA-binding protein
MVMLLDRAAFQRLCLARGLLHDAAIEAPTIERIARTIGVSPFHFIRQFEAVFGRTPHQYRIEVRLARARWLLAADRGSVTDVCFDLGCSSLGSFSDWFARRVGVPPSAYRARARAMVQVPGLPPPELFPGCLSLMSRLPASAFAIFEKPA